MTILVAVKKNNRVFVGADRMTTFGNEYATDLVNGSKIIKLKHGYVATTGYSLMDNVIEHLYVTNSKLIDNTFSNRHEVFSFFLELYNEMKKSYTLIDSGKDTYANFYNAFLVVTAKSIYGISSNLSVHEYERFAARGSGSDYSLGCLYGCYDLIDDGFEIARLALEAACRYSIYCKEPLDIVEVKAGDFGKKSKQGHKARGLSTLFKLKGIGHMVAVRRSPGKNGSTSRSSKAANGNGQNFLVKEVISAKSRKSKSISKPSCKAKTPKVRAKATAAKVSRSATKGGATTRKSK